MGVSKNQDMSGLSRSDSVPKKIDLEALLNMPEPSLIIYDDTWEAQREVRKAIRALVEKLAEQFNNTKPVGSENRDL